MASVQPPKVSTANGPVLRKHIRHRVRYRKTWNFQSDQWLNLDYVEAKVVREAAAPSKSSATLVYAHGKIKREDKDVYADVLPWDLRDSFIQVILLGDGSADPKTESSVLFSGYLPEQTSDLQGTQMTGSQATYGVPGDETMTVMGLEHLLDRDAIGSAWVVNRDEFTEAFKIDRVPIFNESHTSGFTKGGNRSVGKYSPDGDTNFNGSHVFTSRTEGGVDPVLWSVRDIIEYLLVWFVQGDVRFKLSGDNAVIAALDAIKPPRFDARGMTVFDVLNKLLDRRRGFGWRIIVDDSPTSTTAPAVRVHVFTTLDEEVSVGDTKLPANKDVHEIKLDQQKTLAECLVGFSTVTRYGRIVVRGSPLVCMFSVSFLDGTLAAMWTPAEEAAYKAVTGANPLDAVALDNAREDLKFRHVYTSYRIPRTWGWLVKDGIGGSASHNVVPSVKPDGTIDTGIAALSRDWGHTLLDLLPVQREQAGTEHEKDFERPFALIKAVRELAGGGTSETWEFADRMAGEKMELHMLNREFGIELLPSANHILAKNHWASSLLTSKEPEYDYRNVLATVAARADVALSVTENLWDAGSNNPQQNESAMQGRVLYIDVDDAELWYCVPGTVTGVAADGTLRRYAGNGILRDDSPYLRQVAAMAKKWYSKDRATARITFKYIEGRYAPGAYIKAVQDAWGEAKLNCIVSERIWDFDAQTTQVQTSFEELSLDGRNNPTPGLGKS